MIRIFRDRVGGRVMKQRALLFLLVGPAAAGPGFAGSESDTARWFGPLRGPDAAGGDAVHKVPTLINEKIEASGTGTRRFRVLDGNLSAEERAAQLDRSADEP